MKSQLALEMDCDAEDIALTIHAHPTLHESIGMAAEIYGRNYHRFTKRKSCKVKVISLAWFYFNINKITQISNTIKTRIAHLLAKLEFLFYLLYFDLNSLHLQHQTKVQYKQMVQDLVLTKL